MTPHSVIQTTVPHSYDGGRPVITYYEVLGRVRNGYALAIINPTTGVIQPGYTAVDGQPLLNLELVPPTHPVYCIWTRRRLSDRLEGLDRT